MNRMEWLPERPRTDWICAVVFFALAIASPLAAGLRWDATTVERKAKVGEDLLQFAFAFSNTGQRPITVVDLKPGCGCTSVALEKRTYAPGEGGTLIAVLDVKELNGVQEKAIEVFADDSPKPTTLTMRVTVPPWLEVSPRLLSWSVGEPAAAKETIVTLSREAKIKITSVKTDNPAMAVTLQPIDGEHRYRLVAKPESTATPVQATFTIAMAIDGAAPRSYVVFAQVR